MRASVRDSAISRVCRLAPCGCISSTQIDLVGATSYRRAVTPVVGGETTAVLTLWRISMKRMLAALAAAAFMVAPLAAQSFGMPNWSSPKGGTGITISGDLAMPNSDLGKGTAFGARGSVGLANITLTAGIASWKPKGAPDSFTSVGGQA